MATIDQGIASSMPANVDAERSILGAILLENNAYFEAASLLKPDDFFLDSHRRIFDRMAELLNRNVSVDLVTLSEALGTKKELESVGGVTYLSSLTDGLPRRPSIAHYVQIVKDKALLRGLIHAATAAVARASEQAEDATTILNQAQEDIFKVSDQRAGRGFETFDTIFKSRYDSLHDLMDGGKRITGLETHFYDLDSMTSGLQPSDLVIIAARPSMGKTAFAMNIAENAAVKDKKAVAIFSLEMSRESLLLRLLCSNAEVDSHKLRTGFLPKGEFAKLAEAYAGLAEAPLFIDDTPGISLPEMRAKLRQLKQRHGSLDLIIVDYLQLCTATAPGGRRYENRTQEVSAISRGLKALAKDMNVPLIALSQLSRAPETRGGKNEAEPKLSDLRESGAIEQDADLVGFLYRPEVYDRKNEELKGVAKLIVAKQRNGPTGYVHLAFMHSYTKFKSAAAPFGDSGGGE